MALDLNKIRKTEGVTPLGEFPQRVGVGRIIIPNNQDRDQYVKTCYRCGRVDLYDENSGQYLKQCRITQEALQHIKFPRSSGALGTAVVWVSQDGLGGYPVVIGNFPVSGDVNIQDDQAINIHKEWDNGYIDISGSSKDGSLTISVSGQQAGSIFINSVGDENSLLKVRSNGNVEVVSDRKIDVKSFSELTCSVRDVEEKTEASLTINKDGLKHTILFDVEDDSATKLDVNVSKNSVDIGYLDSVLHIEDKKLSVSQGGNVQAVFEDGKLSVTNQITGLKQILSEFSNAIKGLVVLTASGPSAGLGPNSITALQNIDNLLNNLFKE